MAQRLLDRKITIDAFISSPAKRAKKTAELFSAVYAKKETDIIFISALYQASAKTFNQTVEQIDNKYNSVALFSHNTGITEFVNELTDIFKTDNMPTCGVFAVKAAIKDWKEFNKAKKEFLFFDYPKIV